MEKKTVVKIAVGVALVVVLAVLGSFAFAQQAPKSLTIATGASKGTYSTMFGDLNKVCGSRVALVEKQTKGCDDNIDLLVSKDVDGVFCQADSIQFAANNIPRAGADYVRTLVPLYPEEIHIFALPKLSKSSGGYLGGRIGATVTEIKTLSDLDGTRVGAWGGSYTTAKNVMLASGKVQYKVISFKDQTEAFAALDAGQIEAVFAVGGQPLGWAKSLPPNKYKLLTVDAGIVSAVKAYQPATINYRNIDANAVQTISARSLLLVNNIPTAAYKETFAALRDCIVEHLEELKYEKGYHTKWADVDVDAATVWPKYDLPAKAVTTKKGK